MCQNLLLKYMINNLFVEHLGLFAIQGNLLVDRAPGSYKKF